MRLRIRDRNAEVWFQTKLCQLNQPDEGVLEVVLEGVSKYSGPVARETDPLREVKTDAKSRKLSTIHAKHATV